MRSQNIRRRRNPQACGACRERSDGQRPKCSSCRERAKDCRCPGLPDTPTTPLYCVEAAVPRCDNSPQSRCPGDHGDTLDMLRGFPFMTLRNEVFMALLGLDQPFSCHLEQLERSRDAVATLTAQVSGLLISHKHAFHGFSTSIESCHVLLVLAIWSLFVEDASSLQLREWAENLYMGAVMGMLHCILLSIYLLCCVEPYRAHHFVSIASYHLRDILSILDNGRNDVLDKLALADLSYFVAEIAMWKMLHGVHSYAPIIAAELERQLAEWHNILPKQFQFLGKDLEASSVWGSPQVQFLTAQYYAFRTSVYWPAVYQAFSSGKVDNALLAQWRWFFESYSAFIGSAGRAVYTCRPNLWTLCPSSVFILSMAAIVTSRTPCLDSLVSSALFPCFQTATRIFDNVRHLSPSLTELELILAERISWWLSYIG
ncbi:hypothetical protein BDV23DRAFT_177092 [Aspergillus alliaceus]|uniref:Zn(2)-C6 fungal-type domain-containing protein n=1 Tax=Petromyces alliaceus TaxID=209559 RepID=A0A5N7BRW6_PETAA|nr:hypothetical protein BDV23DRAFT_177092 [Aspergillus alliaceus]